jgi:hypothetical protein
VIESEASMFEQLKRLEHENTDSPTDSVARRQHFVAQINVRPFSLQRSVP